MEDMEDTPDEPLPNERAMRPGRDGTQGKRTTILFASSVGLGILGIILLNCSLYKIEPIIIDYTNCTATEEMTCAEMIDEYPKELCYCFINITVSYAIPNAVLYYELPTFDQQALKDSKDDNQLAGTLSPTTSHSCSPNMYNNMKPIAPCGALADAQFTDQFFLSMYSKDHPMYNETHKFARVAKRGFVLDAERAKYRNPLGDLKKAFENFSSPINWPTPIWKLDETNPENNGFQNEDFIIWMDTTLKRKPIGMIKNTPPFFENGIVPNEYLLMVQYQYPPNRYSGQRLFIIEAFNEETNMGIFVPGIILVSISTLGIFVVLYYLIKFTKIGGLKQLLNLCGSRSN